MTEDSILYIIGKESGEAIASIQNALSDKKVSLSEGIGMAKEIGTLVMPIVTRRAELVAAVKDGVDLAEQEDFKAGFIAGYDIEDDATEERVEAVFAGIVTVVGGLVRIFVKPDEEAAE